jgi:hypothetical protein
MPEKREEKKKEPEEKKKRRKKADVYNVEPAEPPVKGPTGEKIFKT